MLCALELALDVRVCLLEERHIQIELTDAAKVHLVRTGYDPNYGARPLKRVIQKEVETALGRLILKGEVKEGQNIIVDLDPTLDELIFTPKPIESPRRRRAS